MREVFQPIAHMLGSETILHDKYRCLSSLCDLPREVSVRSGGSEDVSAPGANFEGRRVARPALAKAIPSAVTWGVGKSALRQQRHAA